MTIERKSLNRFLALAALAALAGCTASTPPAQVTRFHLGQPIAPADVAIEPIPSDPTAVDSLEFQNYAGIVGAELSKLGFRPVAGVPNSEIVAIVDVQRGTRELTPARSPVSVGIGGGAGGGGVGLGGGISFPIGKKRSNDAVGTMLSVQLKRRSEGSVIWEGRAQTEARAGTPYADPSQAVTKLAQAMFAGFPGESGRTITVK